MGRLFRGALFFVAIALVGSQGFAITHSQPATHRSNNFNVWMQIEGIDKGETYTGLCNGSFIADDLVVTAAHCLTGSTHKGDSVTVRFGEYRTITNKKTQTQISMYYPDVDTIKSKRIYFPKAVDQKIRAGKLGGSGNVNAHFDIALIELERPVNRAKAYLDLISFVTPEEHRQISAQPSKHNFVVLSTNMITDMGTSNRRYVEMTGMSLNDLINKAYSIPMYNSTKYSETEEGDSGAPVLVNVSGKWKLFALVKGVKKDLLSKTVEDLIQKRVEITPVINMYTTVAPRMCELLQQAGRSCH